MQSQKMHRKYLILIIIVVLGLMIGITHNAQAQDSVGDTSPFDNGIKEDLFLTGDDIVIDGPVDGDVIAIGRSVTINGPISGSLIAIGRDVFINDEVQGSVYVSGVKLELGETSNVVRSVYFIGLRLIAEPGSMIGRDLTVLSVSAALSGSVGRELNTIIGLLDIFKSFESGQEGGTLVPQNATEIPEEATPEPESMLVPSNFAALRKFDIARKSGLMAAPRHNVLAELSEAGAPVLISETGLLQTNEEEPPIPEWITGVIETFVTLLVWGLLALWLMPKWINRSATQLRSNPLKSTGYGFLGVILSINMLGVVVLVALIVGTVGFFLGTALIWSLAWSIWALGFSTLAIATTLFVLFVLFISKVIVSYFMGWIILERIAPKITKYRVLSFLLGLLIYTALSALPYIGWVAGVIVTALGIGAAWLAYLDHRRERKSETLTEDEVNEELELTDIEEGDE